MIKAENLTKKFDKKTALDHISCSISDNCIYGLVGSNGAGKSTLLRTLAGVYKADGGSVLLDGQPVWENPSAKAKIVYVSDELYYFQGATLNRMAASYETLYPSFNRGKLFHLAQKLKLDPRQTFATFSKGMRRQAMTILALATEPTYIFFDETFDGLDPVIRGFMKRLIIDEMNERNATAVITSHSLRELEDSCDQLALLHKGGLILESQISQLKTSRFKVQIAFTKDYDETKFEGVHIVSFSKSGSVANMIVEGDVEDVTAKLRSLQPLLLDIMPLTLEEVFTYEMQALGYRLQLDAIQESGPLFEDPLIPGEKTVTVEKLEGGKQA